MPTATGAVAALTGPRTTTDVHADRVATWWLTDPRSSRATIDRPCAPTTRTSADRLRAMSDDAGLPTVATTST